MKRTMHIIAWFLALTLVALAVAGCGGKAEAAREQSAKQEQAKGNFPTKPVQILVQSSAGSSTDVMARNLAKFAEKYLGQPLVVIQKTGGATANQQAALLAAPADGYTVGVVTTSHVGAWNTNLKGQFSADQFDFITRVVIDPYVVAVKNDSPFKTLKDMVESAKASGKLRVGGFGPMGGGHNLSFHMLAKAGGFKFTWVPFEGAADAVAAALGGHVGLVQANPGLVTQHVEAGSMRVLGVLSDKKLDKLPAAPTYKEAGYPVDASWSQWRGMYGKKGIPQPVITKLDEAFQKAIKEPEFQKYLKNLNQVDGTLGPEAFAKAVKAYDQETTAMLKELGLDKK